MVTCPHCRRETELRLLSPTLPGSYSCQHCGRSISVGDSEREAELEVDVIPAAPGLNLLGSLLRGLTAGGGGQQQQIQALQDDPVDVDELIQRLLTESSQPDRPTSQQWLDKIPLVRLKQSHFCRLEIGIGASGSDMVFQATQARFGPSLIQSHADKLTQLAQNSPDIELDPELLTMEHFLGGVVISEPIEGLTQAQQIRNGSDFRGKAVLMKRGVIPFFQKAVVAEKLGAEALLVCQTQKVWPFVMEDSTGKCPKDLRVPACMLSLEDSEKLLALIQKEGHGGDPTTTGESEEKENGSVQIRISTRYAPLMCSICQTDFELGEIAVRLPCQHHFHQECVVGWLKKRNTCPLCRFELPIDERAVAANQRSPSERSEEEIAAAYSVPLFN